MKENRIFRRTAKYTLIAKDWEVFTMLYILFFFFNSEWRLEKEEKQTLMDLALAVKEYSFRSQAF